MPKWVLYLYLWNLFVRYCGFTRTLGQPYLKLPHALLVLLCSSNILKYGVHIKVDFTRLFQDCGFQENMDDLPFVGAQELGIMAQDCHLADRANIGLAELVHQEKHFDVGTCWET